MLTLTKWKLIFCALCAAGFAIIALKGVNGHIKLAVGSCLAGITAVTLENWSFIITIAWGLLQIGLLIPDYWRGFWKLMEKINGTSKP